MRERNQRVPGDQIMVVEDDAETRELIAEILREDGYTVQTAANGAEALAALRATLPRPDIILLDLMMPVMSGWQFLDERAADEALARIPVVVLSADPTRQLASSRGIVAVVGKPFDLPRLLTLVRAVTRAQTPPAGG
jgi:CheY-like chemotaxis protein